MSQHKEVVDDAEDIPSDFFDDFNKEEFMEGLSVIDSWDDEGGKPRGPRINAEAIDSVRDLRELIGETRGDERNRRDSRDGNRRSGSRKLEDYIKPGSRRDPSKTKEAIKRDKEVKVKEYLAKKIEGSDDLRPPGTELDDYLDDTILLEKKHATEDRSHSRRSPEKHRRESPQRQRRESPTRLKRRRLSRSPLRPRHSPRRSPRRSPRHSPRWSPRRSPIRSGFDRKRDINRVDRFRPYVQGRRSRSPRRFSPSRYERRERSRSRSPRRDHFARRSRSPTPSRHDSFLYPHNDMPLSRYPPEAYPLQPELYPGPMMEYPGGVPSGYPYQPDPFSRGFAPPYDYAPQMTPTPAAPEVMPPPVPAPQPVPAPMPVPGPMMVPGPVPGPAPSLSLIPMPSAVPAPNKISPVPPSQNKKETKTPFDALAQLVADGKLSKEDYLKLAPNKSKSARLLDASTTIETKARVDVLNRCNDALSRLGTVNVPNHLVINLAMLGPERKALHPKFCSPLKRQASTEFFFTTPSANAAAAHNKQLIDGVIAAIGLTNVVARPRKKTPKNMKDAAVQTTKPYCDVCEIRESTRYYDTSTSIDLDHFSTSTHTQVLEQDLLNSKAVFAPSGSIGDGAPMSIAHLTPAQLVSQLAARAKTLKQTEPTQPAGQFARRPGNFDYDDRDYDNRGGQQYHNYNNYNRY